MKKLKWNLNELFYYNKESEKIINQEEQTKIIENHNSFIENLEKSTPNLYKILSDLADGAEKIAGSPYTVKFIPKNFLNFSEALLKIQEIKKNQIFKPETIDFDKFTIKIKPSTSDQIISRSEIDANQESRVNDSFSYELITKQHPELPRTGADINYSNTTIRIEYVDNFNFDTIKHLMFELCNGNNRALIDFKSDDYININSTEEDYHLCAYDKEKAEHLSTNKCGEILYSYLLDHEEEITQLLEDFNLKYQEELNNVKINSEILFEEAIKDLTVHYGYYVEDARKLHQLIKEEKMIKEDSRKLEEKSKILEEKLRKMDECLKESVKKNEEFKVRIAAEEAKEQGISIEEAFQQIFPNTEEMVVTGEVESFSIWY